MCRKAMFAFQVAGLAVGLWVLYSIVTSKVVPKVVGEHVVYQSPHFYLAPVIVLYLAATCFTGTVSSHMFVRLFGGMALLAFFGAFLFAADAVVSVWCFFAAILSLLSYLHLRYRQLGGFPEADLAVAPMPLAAS